MNKGDDTKHGIYLGERMIDRQKRLTRAEAGEYLDALIAAGHTEVVSDYKATTNNYSSDEEARAAVIDNVLQDRAIVYVFESDGEEVEILVESFKA